MRSASFDGDKIRVRDPSMYYEETNIWAVHSDSIAWTHGFHSKSFCFATFARLNANVEDAVCKFDIPTQRNIESIWISDTFVVAVTSQVMYVYSKDYTHRRWVMDIPPPLDGRNKIRELEHFWIYSDMIICKYAPDPATPHSHSVFLYDLQSIQKYLNPKDFMPANPRFVLFESNSSR